MKNEKVWEAFRIIAVFCIVAMCIILRYGCVKQAVTELKGKEPTTAEVWWYMIVWSK